MFRLSGVSKYASSVPSSRIICIFDFGLRISHCGAAIGDCHSDAAVAGEESQHLEMKNTLRGVHPEGSERAQGDSESAQGRRTRRRATGRAWRGSSWRARRRPAMRDARTRRATGFGECIEKAAAAAGPTRAVRKMGRRRSRAWGLALGQTRPCPEPLDPAKEKIERWNRTKDLCWGPVGS